MIDIDFTKLSTKGQIVLPQDMRKGLTIGEKFVIIKSDDQFILKPVSDFGKELVRDIEFAKKTVDALERYEKGKFKEMDEKAFIDELEKW